MSEDAEVAAITACVRALGGLDRQQQAHVLKYLTDRYASLNELLGLMTQGLEQLAREAHNQ